MDTLLREDMQMFWLYRYKGFSRTAARTVHTAVVLAGGQGWSPARPAHLLVALGRAARGTARDLLGGMRRADTWRHGQGKRGDLRGSRHP